MNIDTTELLQLLESEITEHSFNGQIISYDDPERTTEVFVVNEGGIIYFDMIATVHYDTTRIDGDYWTPGYTESEISSIELKIESSVYKEEILELTDHQKGIAVDKIYNELKTYIGCTYLD